MSKSLCGGWVWWWFKPIIVFSLDQAEQFRYLEIDGMLTVTGCSIKSSKKEKYLGDVDFCLERKQYWFYHLPRNLTLSIDNIDACLLLLPIIMQSSQTSLRDNSISSFLYMNRK